MLLIGWTTLFTIISLLSVILLRIFHVLPILTYLNTRPRWGWRRLLSWRWHWSSASWWLNPAKLIPLIILNEQFLCFKLMQQVKNYTTVIHVSYGFVSRLFLHHGFLLGPIIIIWPHRSSLHIDIEKDINFII